MVVSRGSRIRILGRTFFTIFLLSPNHPNNSLGFASESIPYRPSIGEAVRILESSKPAVDADTYSRLLSSCIRSKSLGEGIRIHDHIIAHSTHGKNSSLLEKLTCMYISCGETELARNVFDQIPSPSIFLWNSMIRAYSWNGPFDRAIDLYHIMVRAGITPNKFTFPFVLKACSGLLALEDGMEIHKHARAIGLELDVFVSTALIDMFMKCGCLDESYQVFFQMPQRDIVVWNAMVAGYALHGLYMDAVSFILEMQNTGITPNSSTVVAVLPVIGQAKALSQGKSVHSFCIRRYLDKEDVLVGTALLDSYAKCDCLGYAQRIFDAMSGKNEVTWSAMIGAYVLRDQMIEALKTFYHMLLERSCHPTSTALLLRACARLTDLYRGKQLHGYLAKSGFSLDTTAGNSLLSMYAKCACIVDAVRFFDEMDSKDTVSYSAIISGCVQTGNAKEALCIFRKMQLSNAVPDIATMVGVIPACSHLAALQHGKSCHGYITVRGFASDTSMCNAVIDMYAKCGRIEFARTIFDRMLNRDIVSWNAIIAGYGIHGMGNEALLLFFDMLDTGLKPDDITFVCLLSACSHSGLVMEGKQWFHAMTQKFNIVPRMEHYICLVDLLGRGGFLDDARDVIERMPLEPDVRVWGALLGACRVHKNIEVGEEVSRMIQKLGPEGTGNFVLLSNLYSVAGRFDDAAKVRILQRDLGFKKSPGSSWIESGGTVHAFVGGDQSHSQSKRIYELLRDLVVEMKKLGFQCDTSFVHQDVEGEEKEHALLYHSEKLAVAYGILTLEAGQPILITKNLRVCGDCHTAIKYITLVTKRAITVRDASRFHHFKDGICNCGDFW